MPLKEMKRILNIDVITDYEGKLNPSDYRLLQIFCSVFRVSKQAALIRLKDVGMLSEQPQAYYYDPLEIIA